MQLYKRIKNILLYVLLLVAGNVAIPAVAQQKSSEEQAKMMTDRQKQQLLLTDEQYSKVYTTNLDFVKRLQQIKQETSGDRLAMYQQFMKLDESRDRQMKAMLTPEQFTLFQKKKKENRKGMADRFQQQ